MTKYKTLHFFLGLNLLRNFFQAETKWKHEGLQIEKFTSEIFSLDRPNSWKMRKCWVRAELFKSETNWKVCKKSFSFQLVYHSYLFKVYNLFFFFPFFFFLYFSLHISFFLIQVVWLTVCLFFIYFLYFNIYLTVFPSVQQFLIVFNVFIRHHFLVCGLQI